MRILMFHPASVDVCPPVLGAARSMRELGARVTLVCLKCSEHLQAELAKSGVVVHCTSNRRLSGLLRKTLSHLGCFRRFRSLLRRQPVDCVWYHQTHFPAWWALVPFRRRRRTVVVLHSHELDSHVPHRWLVQKRAARLADLLLVPEANRGWIVAQFSGGRTPFMVVPNRFEEAPPNAAGERPALAAFQQAGGAPGCTRFVIYQGAFHAGRCLPQIIDAFGDVPDADVGLILLGGEPDSTALEALVERARGDRRIAVLPRVQYPFHLQITRDCAAGILLYAPSSLNNVYCGPNKVYEYASCGLGMVLPDYPGLRHLNDRFGLGALCDPLSADLIGSAIRAVLSEDPATWRLATDRFLRESPTLMDTYREVDHRLAAIAAEKKGRME